MAKVYPIIFSFVVFALAPLVAEAATLSFSPPSGAYNVGGTFSVNVVVSSAEQAMNAASGVVSFPWDKLEVVSISKTGSIFSLWTQEPSFSNSQGTVSFEGIVLNPGYIGVSGKILAITFRARSEGAANVSFSSGSVLANDGTGTNILNGLRVASFALGNAGGAPKPESPTFVGNALSITSITHKDQTKWYTNNTPEFSWELPDGTREVRTLISKNPSGVPSVSYVPPISKKKIDELPDGTYYFALQMRTASGWGAVSRYRVNIDTTAPKPFSITFPHGNTGLDPQPVVLFNTTDDESGISHYEIKIGIDDKPLRSVPEALSNPYVLPARTPGAYTLLVTAVDSAGNVRTSSSEYTIEGLDPPTITYYPEALEEGDILKIRGVTYENSDLTTYVREGNRLITEDQSRSNDVGDFVVVVSKELDPGTYTITVRVKDGRGAQSNETAPLITTVRSEFVADIMSFVLKYLSAAILVLLALSAFAWIGIRLWFRIPHTIARMRREAREAEQVSRQAFKVLRDGVERHVALLKKVKRKLTAEEAEFLKQFDQKLEEAEEVIVKEIRDISHS